MQTHILVTGGAGFIGSHLTDALISRGYAVTILDNKKPADRLHVHPHAKVIEADLTKPETMEMIRLLKPDIIYHFAANANVAKSVLDPAMDAKINYLATVRLLEVASNIGVKRFVFASTGGALSTEFTQLPTPEHAPGKPLCPYAMHKLASEHMGEFYRLNHGVPFVTLRFSNVYGPRQTPTNGQANVTATFAHRMVRNEPTCINGTGRQMRDYVYIDDAIDACLRLLDYPHVTGPLNVGAGVETSVLSIHRLMSTYVGYDREPDMRPGLPGEQMRSCLDISKIAAQMNWVPRVPFDVGICRTIDWHVEHLADLERAPSPEKTFA